MTRILKADPTELNDLKHALAIISGLDFTACFKELFFKQTDELGTGYYLLVNPNTRTCILAFCSIDNIIILEDNFLKFYSKDVEGYEFYKLVDKEDL